MTSTPSTRRQLDGVAVWVSHRPRWRREAPDSLVDLCTGIARPPAAAMPVFMCLCRLVFPDEKLKDRGDDGKNWKKLRAYLLRDRNTILDAIQAFDAHDHRELLAGLQEQYFAEVRPEQYASRRTWATCIAETRPPISDTALARLQAVATFCGRWLNCLLYTSPSPRDRG